MRRSVVSYGIWVVAVTAVLASPVSTLFEFSFSHDLYSHLILIPFVSIYLALYPTAPRIDKVDKGGMRESKLYCLIPLGLGFAGIYFYWIKKDVWIDNGFENLLSVIAFTWVMFLWTGALYFFSLSSLKEKRFSLLFLLFLIPFPLPIHDAVVHFFQHTSAETAYRLIDISGIPIYREGTEFTLPRIKLEVAPQCSGIRASLVLFIVSWVASYLFLQTRWKQVLLIAFIIPLAIARNAFRIFTIALLCFQKGPHMINSWVHHSGGPVFFGLSLIPFFGLLVLLWKTEPKRSTLIQTR